MNVRELKQNYGKDIVFWGGVIDTQKTLPYGSPDQIKDEVKRNIETLAPGGGYVINTVHNIQSDVPPQNLDALFEAINTYR
jgi:uroporphyrinogen decarboxylase